ncbi:MAG: amidohydrolase family protein [Phycisphaerales bacterium]
MTRPNPSNRFGVDYAAEAARFPARADLADIPLIDMHTHINGERASLIHARAADLYGVKLTYSMTWWEHVAGVQKSVGDRVRFIAFPQVRQMPERQNEPDMGLIEQVEAFHGVGARMLKFWMGPRIIDFVEGMDPNIVARLDAEPRLRTMERAAELDMMFMVHVGDPDTWFRTMYADTERYRTKPEHYDGLRRVLKIFHDRPWIAAHMGGWPEDLEFLTRLLDDHENLYLDTSACKWMVRELSRHPRDTFVAFLERFQDRIMFGSDIVTTDEHLEPADGDSPMGGKAASEDEAFDLYASRYWALRTLFETTHDGESPIADPDLMMEFPDDFDAMSAPRLAGHNVPAPLLRKIYHDNAKQVLGHWYGDEDAN